MGLTVLHRDAWLMAVDKPSGLAVHRGLSADRDTLVDRLRALTGTVAHPAHRLDRGTSGVLLSALDSATARALGAIFAANEARKTYGVLVRGRFPEAPFELDHPVPSSEDGPRVPARTGFQRLGLSSDGRWSWVAAFPRTGRFHQIRRHLKHLSHPVVGDVNYGKGDVNRHFRERFALHRLALHAASLELLHPVLGTPLRVAAPLPSELCATLAALGIAETAWDAAQSSWAPSEIHVSTMERS